MSEDAWYNTDMENTLIGGHFAGLVPAKSAGSPVSEADRSPWRTAMLRTTGQLKIATGQSGFYDWSE